MEENTAVCVNKSCKMINAIVQYTVKTQGSPGIIQIILYIACRCSFARFPSLLPAKPPLRTLLRGESLRLKSLSSKDVTLHRSQAWCLPVLPCHDFPPPES